MKAQTIQGKGDSLWGISNGAYTVNKAEVYLSFYSEKNELYGELQLFGENTEWIQYTDSGIEKAVNRNKVIKAEIVKQIKAEKDIDVKPETIDISWSEQGMQPDGGWSFDFDCPTS